MKQMFVARAAALAVGVFFAAAPLQVKPAMAQPQDCSRALQFDTSMVQRNSAMQLAILNTVNSSNYDAMKTNLSASIPEYFGGSFSQFSEKRSQLQSSFSQQQQSTISETLYTRALSPAGAQAYALCIQGRQNFVAWVSSTGIAQGRVAVTVRNNLPGNGSIEFTVVGATPVNQPVPLTSGSEQTLYFNSPRSEPFFAVINGRNAQSGANLSVPAIELPAYIEYRREDPEFLPVIGTGQCAAGCQGNTSGCQAPRSVTISAPDGFTLQPDTLRQTGRTLKGGIGINIDPPWTWTRTPIDAPLTMIGVPGMCDGADSRTQSTVEYEFTVRAMKPGGMVRVP